MDLSPTEHHDIVKLASRLVADQILTGVTDIDDLVTLPMGMVEQVTGLGSTQIARRMTVRALSHRKRGVSLKAVRAYLKTIETSPEG